MQIHGGIWAWFIRLLQSACPQQDSVVRIKGYTIWKRSIRHLSLSLSLFPLMVARYELPSLPLWKQPLVLCMLMVFMPFEYSLILNISNTVSHLLLLFTGPCVFSKREARSHQIGSLDCVQHAFQGWFKISYLPAGYHCLVYASTHNRKSQYQFWMGLRDTGWFLMSYSRSQTFCFLSVVFCVLISFIHLSHS